ncbi:WDR13 [Bugula neritina]|uniref:WDR13 n=1 Tax=Bugula neritina TaxID=10212 RepID=A0A7J7J0E8_BUGNE|nr:WDR13 [Bugula neritina]
MATLWQQVVALDARYNAYRVPDNPQYRTLYMRRRSHLLRENAASLERDVGVRRDYIKLRNQLLAERYGPATVSEQGSLHSKATSISSNRYPKSKGSEVSRSKLPVRTQKLNDTFQHSESTSKSGITPTVSAEASRAITGNKSLSENYAFSGMHHIFDQHRSAVVAVKFANDDKSRVACCSYDGTISVMQVIPTPPL